MLLYILAALINLSYCNDTIIITRSGCPYSKAMRTFFSSHRVPYTDLNETVLNADIRMLTQGKGHTYPTVFYKGKLVGGYEEALKNRDILKAAGLINVPEASDSGSADASDAEIIQHSFILS